MIPTTVSGSGQVAARINRLPITRVHVGLAVLLSGLFLFELGDINTFGDAAPALIKYLHFTVADVANITGAFFLGSFLGAWLGGYVADRKGRKFALLAALIWYSVFSFTSAMVSTPGLMYATRLLTGIGAQAFSVIGITYISEMFPKTARGRYQAMALGIGLLGIPIMAWWARLVVPTGPDGWRWIFVLGGVGVILAFAVARWLPESPRWYEGRGDHASAERVLSAIEERVRRYVPTLPEPSETFDVPVHTRVPIAEIFGPSYRKRTIVLTIVWIFNLFGFYGFQAWIPTLLYSHGYTLVRSLLFTSIISLGAVPGAFLAWPFTDRFQRRWLIVVGNLIVAAAALGYGLSKTDAGILVFGLIVALVSQTQTAFFFSYNGEIFPTRVRSTASGFANGVGRLFQPLGSVLVALVFTHLGFVWVFVYVMVVWLIATTVLAIWGENTTRLALEEIAR